MHSHKRPFDNIRGNHVDGTRTGIRWMHPGEVRCMCYLLFIHLRILRFLALDFGKNPNQEEIIIQESGRHVNEV